MKHSLATILAAGVAIAAVSPGIAAEGCGAGFHRGPHGACRPNGGDRVVGPVIAAPFVPSIGVYYDGRGYWDGHRYWQHRERWKGGWRYR